MEATPQMPGKVQTIAIMQLVGGIMAVISAVVIAISTLFLWITWIYALVVGIMAIIRGAKLLGNAAYGAGNSKTVPIMMIINIINCDAIGLTMGIICLVFQGDPEVEAYLEGRSA